MARSDKYTALYKQAEYYSDFTNNLDLNPDTGYLATLTNENAIKNSIRNLVLTNKFERFYQPMVGSKVQSLNFEMAGQSTNDLIVSTILETITNYEPRALNVGARVESYIDDNTVNVTIIFSMVNVPQPIAFSLIVRRVR